MDLIKIIEECARVPSFSTYEERLHPFIYRFLSDIRGINIDLVYDNNLVINVPGKRENTIAITAHLDKINHYGLKYPSILDFSYQKERITGQLDDSVGIGICLHLIQKSLEQEWPNLLILFSEMEESYGLKNHPHLLKQNGAGVEPQAGAKRLCEYLSENSIKPSLFVTIDTTPIFKGEQGVALYTEHWEKTKVFPDEILEHKIALIRSFFAANNSAIKMANGNNDYLVYGRYFGCLEKGNIPSIAIEPAIFPYHQIGESIFVEDVLEIVRVMDVFLSQFDFEFGEVSSV